MGKLSTRSTIATIVTVVALVATVVGGSLIFSSQSHAAGPRFKSYEDFANYIRAHHKAPYELDVAAKLPQNGAAALVRAARGRTLPLPNILGNVKVNQDRNPWPKAEIAAAIDPTNGNNIVVMSNDFRENYDHMFYHVSTDGGATWTDDSMAPGVDPFTGFVPFSFQSDPGVAFDSVGNSTLSTITGNLILDFGSLYENLDTQIEVTQGFAHGTYTTLLPTGVDTQPCNGTFGSSGTFSCPASLDKPLVTTDTVTGSPNENTTYVYYTLFCNGTGSNGLGPCTDGSATVPAFSSAILESHSAGAGLPFSTPALVSGSLTQEQFSDMVIDKSGTPHIFFDDFSGLAVNMYESTLTGGSWVVNMTPVATFSYNGMNNVNWGFRDFGTVAPGCAIGGNTAYCAFSASQIGNGPVSSTPNVYVAHINTGTGASIITRVNNDPFGDSKHHFFPWTSVIPGKAVYVGWYDDRNDPFNTRVQYFVAKSTDGGTTFPTQQPVNAVPFNPCVGFPGCGFFGDYTQLVTGPDGVTHAAWSDTRDAASMQIWSQAITW